MEWNGIEYYAVLCCVARALVIHSLSPYLWIISIHKHTHTHPYICMHAYYVTGFLEIWTRHIDCIRRKFQCIIGPSGALKPTKHPYNPLAVLFNDFSHYRCILLHALVTINWHLNFWYDISIFAAPDRSLQFHK